MSVRAYLVSLKQKVAQNAVKLPYYFVTGNQSADMDSVISSITYAYLAHSLVSPENVMIPIINIPKADFKLRRDISKLLSFHNITEDLLYFIEDYSEFIEDYREKKGTQSEGNNNNNNNNRPIKLNLVDHNGLQGNEIIQSFDKGLVNVVGIIDHHADENKFLDANPRIIKTCGSNSSMVFDYFYGISSDNEEFWNNTSELVELLLGPLLIDTSNMTQKVEDLDTKAFHRYKEILATNTVKVSNIDSYLNNFYKTLKTAKKDLSGFEFGDILRKDYKQFKFANGINVGFSSIGKSLWWICSNFSKTDIKSALLNSLKINNIDLLVVTSSYTQKENNKYTREFCYYYEGENAKFAQLSSLISTQLQLNDDLYGGVDIKSLVDFVNNDKRDHLEIYNQQNIRASRKQVVPIVKEAIEEH